MSNETPEERFGRPALLFEQSDARKQTIQPTSRFGRVTHGLPGEKWPNWEGTTLAPLLQLNLSDCPFRPSSMLDVAFLTLFIHPDRYPEEEENGTAWCLRTYPSCHSLRPLDTPKCHWGVTEIALDHPILVEDYPCFQDLVEDVDDRDWVAISKNHPTRDGIKVGGWPRLLQSEILWAPDKAHPAKPEYAFQVDGLSVADWSGGERGCVYLGRGTASGHKHTWCLQWQSL
jgi:hypothetical protein